MTKLLATVFLLSQFLCHVLATVECGAELPSGYVKFPGDNTANKIYMELLKWEKARERCLSEGAHLAVAITYDKIQHIQNRAEGTTVWLGIHRPLGWRGDWVRNDTGLPVTSLPWIQFTIDEDWDCALTTTHNKGKIYNYPCIYGKPFACEISIAEGCQDPVDPEGSQGTNVTSQVP